MDLQNLRTIPQFVAENEAFTIGGVRWLIFNAETNGLSRALVRPPGSRRVLIDTEAFAAWLDSRNADAVA